VNFTCAGSIRTRRFRRGRHEDLAAKRACEFALVVQSLKIQGGTGSTVAPVAVR
jgi:hypothetical protein